MRGLLFAGLLPVVFPGMLWATAPKAAIVSPYSDATWLQGLPYSLSASADQEGVTFKWTFSNGDTYQGATIEVTAPGPGSLQVTMVATNAIGESAAPDNRLIYVTDIDGILNQPAVTRVLPQWGEVNPNMTFSVTAQASDPNDDGPFTYRWFWLENDRPMRREGETITISLPAGAFDGYSYSIYCTAFNHSGTPSYPIPASVAVVAGNLGPRSHIVEPAGRFVSILAGSELQFRAEGVDPENNLPLSYRWVGLGDGFLFGQSVSWRFDEPGLYAVVVIALDSLGNEEPLDVNNAVQVRVFAPDEIPIPEAYILQPRGSTRIFRGDSLILTGLAPVETTASKWLVSDVLTGEVVAEAEGAAAQRLTIDRAGLFELRFRTENLGVQSLPNRGNGRWIAVHERDSNQPPQLSHVGSYRKLVRNGSSVNLEVAVSDPDGDEVSLVWAQEGKIVAKGGSSRSFTFNLPPESFNGGYYPAAVETLAVDGRGKAMAVPLIHSVLVYQDLVPPTLGINHLPSGSTVYVAIGEDYPLEPVVDNPDNRELAYYWAGYLSDEIFPFFESMEAHPGSIRHDQPGVASLIFTALTQDRTASVTDGSALFIHFYDPAQRPKTRITQPSSDQLVVDVGLPVTLAGQAIEPNFLPAGFTLGQYVVPVTNRLTWRIVSDNGFDQSISRNEPLTLTLDEPGLYQVTLQAENNLGLAAEDVDSLSVTVRQPPGDQAYEPNDTRAQATRVEAGSYGGVSVGPDDPEDWYLFTQVKEGAAIELDIDLREAAAAVTVQVFQGERLVQDNLLQPGSRHPFTFAGGAGGDYYLRLVAETVGKRIGGASYSFSLGELTPRLTFNYIKSDEVEETLLTLVNPFGEAAAVNLVAHDQAGLVLGEFSLTLPARGHWEEPVSGLFSGVDPLSIAWVHTLADSNIVGLATTLARDELTCMAETATIGSLDQLVVPHIAQDTGFWFTRAAIANTSGEQVETGFRALAGDFDVPGLKAENESSLIDFEAFFQGSLPVGSEWGTFVEREARPGLSGLELFGTKSGAPRMAALNLSSAKFINPNYTYEGRDIYFPHIAKDRRSFWTGIAFVNTDAAPIDVRLIAYSDEGQVLAEEVIPMAAFDKRVGLAQSFFTGLPESAEISWIQCQTTGPVSGYALFGDNGTEDRRLAGMPAVRAGSREVYFQKILHEPGRYWTGLAAVNLSPTQNANLHYIAYDDAGQVVATADRAIGPYRKDVIVVEALFGGVLPAGTRWIRLTSDQPLAAFELFGDIANNFMAGALAQ